jgi:uncharacterized protein (TIGR02466 family)
MEITPIFPIAIGKAKVPELLDIARKLFEDNQAAFGRVENGFATTLQRYNSTQDCAFLNNQQAVANIKNKIKEKAIIFYESLGFDISQLEFEVVNLWLNEMSSGGVHSPHFHYGFQVSGCFYVDTPQNSNAIDFYTPHEPIVHGNNPEKEYTQYNGKYYRNSIENGDMFFWESLLKHGVPALEFKGVRRSIAYDLSISRKLNPTTGSKYKMQLQDYVAIYNINNPLLCQQTIQMMREENWEKHSYSNVTTNTNISYTDDLEVSYQENKITIAIQNILENCACEYINNFVPNKFKLQALTGVRFNRYKVGTNMKPHHDHIHTIFDGDRKGVPIISVLALLNDDFEGGDFLMFDSKKLKLVAGDVIVFPSNFLYPHAVTTITKGTRYSCVSWGY